MEPQYGDSYSGTAFTAGAGDSFSAYTLRLDTNTNAFYNNAHLQGVEADGHYVNSPYLGFEHDETASLYAGSNYGHNTVVSPEEESMFPPFQNGGEQFNQSNILNLGNELYSERGSLSMSGPNWDFGGSTIGDRLFQPNDANQAPRHSLPVQQASLMAPKVMDLRFAPLLAADGQDIEQEMSDLIVKITQGYNIQEMHIDGPMDGVEALKQGLAANSRQSGQRGLLPVDIQNLLLRGGDGDPVTSNGHLIQRLTANNLLTALRRYGASRNEDYNLGIVRAQETFGFEISVLPHPQPRQAQIIWVYQEPTDWNPITRQYDASRWSSIVPSNVPTKSYAQALKLPSPKPKPREAQIPVNTQLLHVGRPSTGSTRTGTQSGSSSSSTPIECCGRTWGNKTLYRNHEKSHAPQTDRPFKCEHCGKGFLWQKDLVRHMPKHNGSRAFSCPVHGCKKSYTRRDNMVRHHDQAHPGMAPLSQKSQTSSGSGRHFHA